MAGLPLRYRRRGPRSWPRPAALSATRAACGAALFGRSLYLAPPAYARVAIASPAIDAALQTFRRRLHRQRAAVALLRAACLAAFAVSVVLFLRIRGVALPLPAAPVAIGAAVLAAGACIAAFLRPSAPEMAHALDRRLDLREQIATALEIDPGAGSLAATLGQRAARSLHSANADFVLPWPALKRERIWLGALALLVVPMAFAAANAHLPRSVASAPALAHAARSQSRASARPNQTRLPLSFHALGGSSFTTHSSARLGRVATAGHLAAGRAATSGRFQTGNALGLRSSGSARPGTPGAGTRNGSGVAGQPGSPAGRGSTLRLTTGKNSAAGGVMSAAQQQLMNLQHSISLAGGAQGQQGAGTQQQGGPQGSGQGQVGKGVDRRGTQANSTGSSQAGGRNHTSGGSPSGAGASGNRSGSHGASGQSGPLGGDGDPTDRMRRGAAGGTGAGGATSTNASGSRSSGARLGDNGNVVLNGAAGPGGTMILSAGTPNRGLGLPGASLYGSTTAPLVPVPGYVAPDSNSVAPDARSAVQGYFSPPPSGS